MSVIAVPGPPSKMSPALREKLEEVIKLVGVSGSNALYRYPASKILLSRAERGVVVPLRTSAGNVVVLLSQKSKVTEGRNPQVIVLSNKWGQTCEKYVKPLSGFEQVYQSVSTVAAVKAVLVDYIAVVEKVLPELRERVAFLERELEQEREIADKALAAASNVRLITSILSKLSPEQLAEMAMNVNTLLLRIEELKLTVEDGFSRVLTELKRAKIRLEAGDVEGAKKAIATAEAVATNAVETAKGQLPSFAEDNPWLALLSSKKSK